MRRLDSSSDKWCSAMVVWPMKRTRGTESQWGRCQTTVWAGWRAAGVQDWKPNDGSNCFRQDLNICKTICWWLDREMIWATCKHHSPAWWGQQQREALRLTWFWWRKETRENTPQRHMHIHHPEMSYWVMLLLISERQSSTAEVIIPVLPWCDGIFCLVHLQILEVIVKSAADRDGARSVNTCHNSIFFLVNYCCWFLSISVHNY